MSRKVASESLSAKDVIQSISTQNRPIQEFRELLRQFPSRTAGAKVDAFGAGEGRNTREDDSTGVGLENPPRRFTFLGRHVLICLKYRQLETT